jgi:hypothetical protein
MPRPMWNQRLEDARKKKSSKQGTLDSAFGKVQGPREFTRTGVLDAVARFVVCDDQVSSERYLKDEF